MDKPRATQLDERAAIATQYPDQRIGCSLHYRARANTEIGIGRTNRQAPNQLRVTLHEPSKLSLRCISGGTALWMFCCASH
jgi:hypothetical protein